MMRVAIVENGIVVNVVIADSVESVTGGIECVEAVNIGWTYDGESFAPPPELAPEPVDLIAYAAQRRWQAETGGIEVGGMTVYTDDRSKMMIMGARIAAEANPEFATQWKAADGSFVEVDAATIIAISDAVLAHVDSCFAIEAQVLAGIENETITTTAEIDAAFAD